MNISEAGVSHSYNTRDHSLWPQVTDKLGELTVASMHGVQHPIAVILREEAKKEENKSY